MANLDPGSIKRLSKQLRHAERSPRFPAIGDRRSNKAANIRPNILAVLTTALTGRVGTSLGSGKGILQILVNGTYSPDGDPVTIWNMLTVSVPLSVAVVKVAIVDGHPIADLADCATTTTGTTGTGTSGTTTIGIS